MTEPRHDAVLVIGFGGPESMDDVRPFLLHFGDEAACVSGGNDDGKAALREHSRERIAHERARVENGHATNSFTSHRSAPRRMKVGQQTTCTLYVKGSGR